jgi:hypothetical protein
MKLDAEVDMLEFKKYSEIDLDESPVVALACGHFFTVETLDGMYNSHVSSMASAVIPVTRTLLFFLVVVGSKLRAILEEAGLTRPTSI